MDFSNGGGGIHLARQPGNEVGRRLASWFLDLHALRDASSGYRRPMFCDSQLTNPDRSAPSVMLWAGILPRITSKRRHQDHHTQHLGLLQNSGTLWSLSIWKDIPASMHRPRFGSLSEIFHFIFSLFSEWIQLNSYFHSEHIFFLHFGDTSIDAHMCVYPNIYVACVYT